MSDLISRRAAISLPVKPKEDRYFQTQNLDDAYDYGWYDLQECIEKMPPAQPERKKGAWINEGRIIRCNRCKIGYATVKGMKSALTYKFCPNCGADMRGERNDE